MKKHNYKLTYINIIKIKYKFRSLKLFFILVMIFCCINCSNDMKILFHDTPLVNEISLFISWETTQDNILADGGWKISDDGRTIKFEIEDSGDCLETGGNDEIQSGTATATITTSDSINFTPLISGIGELQDIDYEILSIKLDDELIATSQSSGGDIQCEMGPVNINSILEPPFILGPGNHTFNLEFTTEDGYYHVGAYYELKLIFTEIDYFL